MSDMTIRYRAAEKLLPYNLEHAVLNGKVRVIQYDSNHFVYPLAVRKDGNISYIFRLVCTDDGSEEDLFDHEEFCSLLQTDQITFDTCEFSDGRILFSDEKNEYEYDPESGTLHTEEKNPDRAVSVSPDGAKEVFVKDCNLYLHDLESGETVQLTDDGTYDHCWAKCGEYSGYITDKEKGKPEKPEVLWSPDGRYFLTLKLDQEGVKDLYILKSFDEESLSSIRPRLLTYRCAFPEDEKIPLAQYYICDTETRRLNKADMKPQMSGGSLLNEYMSSACWLADSSAVFTAYIARGHKSADFIIIYPDGSTDIPVHEEAESFLNIGTYGTLDGYGSYRASNFLSEDHKYVFFQSERDGFARIYRYDAKSHELLNAVTPENVIAGSLIHADDENGWLYFYASNLECTGDPYYQLVCRASYDGSTFEILTPEDAMHRCEIVSAMIIDTFSRVDLPPVTVLRRTDGTLIRTLLKADVSDLMARGYILPERFAVTASDGMTKLYGILIRPADFDETKLYPFIDYIYGGMQCYNVPKAFQYKAAIEGREIMGGLEEMAQLGFAGIILDGLGTPGRGKKLHDISYENIHGCAGLKDHVYVLKQLKEKYPFLDTERAGIWGNSGGGCAASRAMLEYPGVYRAAVSSAGNHDQRMYNNHWTENYYGLYDEEIYKRGDNTALAKNLEGKLFIVHGAMDDNVAMSQSIRLVDALIKEDKDFDFLILPRCNHNVPADPYFIRRKMDYFVKWLLDEEVPAYRFAKPE